MRKLGYNCVAKISSKTNRETDYISQLFQFDIPVLKSSVSPGTRFIATDHEEYSQSVDGADEAMLLQIIDHHTEGDMATSGVPFIYRKMVFGMVAHYVDGLEVGSYILYHGDGSREVAEKAFGSRLRDGVCYVEGRLSRKRDVVPLLKQILE